MNDPDNQDDWMSAKDALRRYAKANGNSATLSLALGNHLRFEELQARARKIVISLEPTVSAAWKAEKSEHKSADLPNEWNLITADYFQRSTNWPGDVHDWRWQYGDFSLTHGSKKSKQYILLRKVEFRASDLRELLNSPDNTMPSAKRRSSGDEKRRNFGWLLTLALFDVAKGGQRRRFQSVPKAVEAMIDLSKRYGIGSFGDDSRNWQIELKLFADKFPDLFLSRAPSGERDEHVSEDAK